MKNQRKYQEVVTLIFNKVACIFFFKNNHFSKKDHFYKVQSFVNKKPSLIIVKKIVNKFFFQIDRFFNCLKNSHKWFFFKKIIFKTIVFSFSKSSKQVGCF